MFILGPGLKQKYNARCNAKDRMTYCTDLPGDGSGVVRVDLHEDHVQVVVDKLAAERVADGSSKLELVHSALLLVVRVVEMTLKQLQLDDGQLLFQLQRNPPVGLFCTATRSFGQSHELIE